jgi:flagellum-specific peptidoglycan hydrolase FlgJ
MTARLVPTVRTSYKGIDLIKGFIDGWVKAFNEIPSKETVGVLYAQNALETGGTVFMWNNNIGNIKYIPSVSDTGDYMMLNNVWEIINGKKVIFQPPHQATWFKSYPTLADGVAQHYDFIKNRRYAKAWSAVESGNPAEFAHLLKLAGYYTAPESDYIRGMNNYFNKYMSSKLYEQAISNAPVVSTWTQIGNIFNRMFKS